MLILLTARAHTSFSSAAHTDDDTDDSSSTLSSSLHSLWLTLLYFGLASLLLLACIILILYRKRYDDTQHTATHSTLDPHTARLWIGHADTDTALPSPTLTSHSPTTTLIPPTRDRNTAEAYLLLTSNVCRSLNVECSVLQSLPDIGHRTARYYCHVQHAVLGDCMMAVARVDDCAVRIAYTQHKRFHNLRSYLTSLHHPHVLPCHDAYYLTSPHTSPLPSHHYAFLTPLAQHGSLRDHLHTALYSHPYATKYYTPTHQAKRGTPLAMRHVRTFTRHILSGLLYLRGLGGLAHYSLHSGNVLLFKEGREARAVLCGVEGVVLGWRSRYHRKLRRSPLRQCDPILASVALILYEMCTGHEADIVQGGSGGSKGEVDLSLPVEGSSREYGDAADFIDLILYATHTVTLDELITHRLCTAAVTHTAESGVGGREERCEGKIVRKLLIPVHSYFVFECYKRHPHTVADSLWYAREGGWLEGGGVEGAEEGGGSSKRKKKHRHRKSITGDAIV